MNSHARVSRWSRSSYFAPRAFGAALALAFAGSILCASAHAQTAAQAGQSIDATLASGDVIRGVLVSDDGKTLVLNHPVLGQISIAKDKVSSVVLTPQAAPPPPPPPPVPAAPVVKPDPESFFEGWTGSVEFGLNGSDGNSQTLSFRAGVNAKRETSKTVTTAGLSYQYSNNDGDKSQDRGEFNVRNDWKIDAPWRLYATGKVEYDQFKEYDWRVSFFGGVGYEFIKTDSTLLLGRVGFGFSKEFGSSDNRIKPEADLGLDFEHKIDERQKLTFTVDYYPSVLNFAKDYRVVGKAAYEVVVDPTNGLSLKLGVEDTYQGQPSGGARRNDVTYFALLVFNF